MPSDKELESTEKLLRIIRKDDTVSPSPAQADITDTRRPVAQTKNPTGTQTSPVFSGGSRPCLAVQIGKQALYTALVSYQKGRPAFQDLRSFAYPADLIPEGAAFGAFLGACIQKASAGAKPEIWTFIGLDYAEYSSLKLPNVPAKDLHPSVFWAVKKEAKFNEKAHVFDYRVLDKVMDKGVEKRQVIYFLAQLHEVERLKALFKQAGFPLSGISIEPLAFENFFATQWAVESDNIIAHLQLGEDNSRIDILDHGRLLFSRSIKFGSNSFIDAIQEGLALPEQESILGPDTSAYLEPLTPNTSPPLAGTRDVTSMPPPW